ncbi:hypothetical protein D3C71_1513700 [compost metagenome]
MWLIWTTKKRMSCCSPPTSPALSAATACANSNRACFRSTTRLAPAQRATVWAYSSSSIRNASCKTPSFRWPAVPFAVGIVATSTTSRCCVRWQSITRLTLKRLSTAWTLTCRKRCSAAPVKNRSNSNTSTIAVTPPCAAIRSKACCTTWSAVIKKPNPVRCAKSWRSLSATVLAPRATAPVCAKKRETCSLKTPRCRKSPI